MLAAVLMVLATPAFAQDGPPEEEVKAAEAGMTAFRNGEYMKAETLLRPFAFDDDGTLGTGYAAQMWEQAHAAIADWLPPPRKPASGLDETERARLERATFVDAIDEIVRRARDTRVVILNEDHSDSRDRAFALEVARALRPLGYDTLAAETLANDANEVTAANQMELIAERGALVRTDGYYTRDPVFADFIRQALALGYRPMAYEETSYDRNGSPAEQIARRERQQAEYLFDRTLRHRPDAKVLIYVGFSHAAENPVKSSSGGKQRWMAARLKSLTGIDPLTIDQTTIRLPDPPAATDDPLVQALAPRLGDRSVVAMAGSTPVVLGPYEDHVDLQVIHPPARVVDGRPDWLAAMGREPIAIPDRLLPTTGKRLVQAFAADEPTDAIPLDQVIVTAGEPAPPLLIPPDVEVRYAVEDEPKTAAQERKTDASS
jgi:hypothetical protein